MGVPTVLQESGIGTVFSLSEWHANVENNGAEAFANDFKKQFKSDFLLLRAKNALEMLVEGSGSGRESEGTELGGEVCSEEMFDGLVGRKGRSRRRIATSCESAS